MLQRSSERVEVAVEIDESADAVRGQDSGAERKCGDASADPHTGMLVLQLARPNAYLDAETQEPRLQRASERVEVMADISDRSETKKA